MSGLEHRQPSIVLGRESIQKGPKQFRIGVIHHSSLNGICHLGYLFKESWSLANGLDAISPAPNFAVASKQFLGEMEPSWWRGIFWWTFVVYIGLLWVLQFKAYSQFDVALFHLGCGRFNQFTKLKTQSCSLQCQLIKITTCGWWQNTYICRHHEAVVTWQISTQ